VQSHVAPAEFVVLAPGRERGQVTGQLLGYGRAGALDEDLLDPVGVGAAADVLRSRLRAFRSGALMSVML